MDDEVSKLVAKIYSAFLTQDEINPMLEGVIDFVGGKMGFLWIEAGHTSAAAVFDVNLDPDAVGLYNAHYGALDPRAENALASSVGSVVHFQEVVRNDEMRNTEYFEDFLPLIDTADGLNGIIGRSPAAGNVGMAIHRRFGDDFFDKTDSSKLTFLMQHHVKIGRANL